MFFSRLPNLRLQINWFLGRKVPKLLERYGTYCEPNILCHILWIFLDIVEQENYVLKICQPFYTQSINTPGVT